jgi:hypothetical protein
MNVHKKRLGKQIILTRAHKWKDDKRNLPMQANDSRTKEV